MPSIHRLAVASMYPAGTRVELPAGLADRADGSLEPDNGLLTARRSTRGAAPALVGTTAGA